MPLNEFQRQEALKLFSEGKSTTDVYKHLGAKSAGFKSPITFGQSTTPETQSSNVFADIPQDIGTGITQLAEGYQDRFGRLVESGSALARGGQTIPETAIQFGANIAGGAIADPAYQLARTGASFLTTPQQEEQIAARVGQTVQQAGEKTGLTDWWGTLEPRTQRNISAALDIADVLPAGLFGKVKSLFRGAERTVSAEAKLTEAFTKAQTGDVSDATRVANAVLDDATREAEVTKLADAYQSALVGDRVKVNRLLQEQANEMSRGDVLVTQDDLVKALAAEGIIPDIRGKLADFTTEIRNLDRRQNELFNAYEPILAGSKATASIDDFASYAKRSMADSRNLRFELDKANSQLDRLIKNLREGYNLDEGGTLSAKQIDDISREANARSKAYRESGDPFQADVYSELGRAARSWLGENIPDQAFRQVNDQWLRLENLKRTAESMQNQQIDVGILGRALGSYVTTLTGVTLGAAASNPFTAVAAGILTKMGGDAIADVLRTRKFSPEVRSALQERLTSDRKLIQDLRETATNQENKNLYDELSRMLPPGRPDAPRSEVGSGAPIEAPGQTPSGRVEPGLTERVREGAIKQPVRSGTFTRQAQRFKTPESFKKAVESNPAWKAKLEAAGVTPDQISKLVFGSAAGLALVYLLEDEQLAPLQFMIVGSILGGKEARGLFVKQISRQASPDDLSRMGQFVRAYDEGAFKGSGGQELKIKATKSFTEEEATDLVDTILEGASNISITSQATFKELRDIFDEALQRADKRPQQKRDDLGRFAGSD